MQIGDVIDEKYHPMIQLKIDAPGKAIMTFRTPSGQYWASLGPRQRQELDEIVSLNGQKLDDLLFEMRKVSPDAS